MTVHPVPSLIPRVVAVLTAPPVALLLLSCHSSATKSENHTNTTGKPVVTGEPAGYNNADISFANGMIACGQQGIDMSPLVPDHSASTAVVAFSAQSASGLRSYVQTLRVLLVQWNENPDSKTDSGGHGDTAKGLVDPATIARLNSLHGNEFDTLWLQSMISLDQGAIEIANTEIANGKNVDATGLAKQIAGAQMIEISQMEQLLKAG